MESHCFGCEGVFRGKQAEGIAERVFRQLLVKTPEKPQVHYLFGILRQEQERYGEALTHFRAAVKLDPDYLNAWKEIESVGEHVQLPQADHDAAALNTLRLDPQLRHSSPDLSGVSDLRALWAAVEAALKLQPPPVPKTLYPLPASRAELERYEAQGIPFGMPDRAARWRESGWSRYAPRGADEESVPLASPAAVIAQQEVVFSAGQLLDRTL
jgi:tetratricopeptide (TPR) repeat protein